MAESLQLGFDREGEIDRRIDELLTANSLQPWPLTEDQRVLLRMLKWHKGEQRPIRIAVIQGKLSLTDREIKEAVRSLDYGLPIVGLRRPPYGYFVAITPEEVAEAVRPLRNEVLQIARRIRALRDSDYLREMLGQIPFDLDKEAS